MSDFWVRKMKTYFNRIDFDKDGNITLKDFEGMGERFVEAEKLNADAGKVMKEKLVAIWNQYISTLGDKSESINEEKFIQAMSVMVKDPSQKERIAGPLPLFFQAVDANGDDFIDSSEFGIFFKIFGLDENMAPASFQAIDTNNDGLLSKDEFITAGTDFFTSEDAACPTKLFWGPLV